MDTYDFDELLTQDDASSRAKKSNTQRGKKLECEDLSLFDETIEPDSSESTPDEEEDLEELFELEEDDDDLYDENNQPREHTFVVGNKTMTCIFPKRLFKDDYEPTSKEKLLKVYYEDEWAEAYSLYHELLDEYHLGSKQAQQMQNGDNPLQYPFSEKQPTGIDRIKKRFEGMVAEFDRHNKPALVKEYPLEIKEEYVFTELFDRIKSKDIIIKNKKNIRGSIDKTEFRYWAIKPFVYSHIVNGNKKIYNYYEIYSKSSVCCVICETNSLKKILENNGYEYDHAIITKQILESAKHLPLEEVPRIFDFHWFEHAFPINEPIVLSDSDVNQLLWLPWEIQELIFTVLGYSVLALIAPDMSDQNKIKGISIFAENKLGKNTDEDTDEDSERGSKSRKSKKAKKSQNEISYEVVEGLKKLTSACFVSGGGCDLPHTICLNVRALGRTIPELCERRIVLLDTTDFRDNTGTEQENLRKILGEYLQYANRFEPQKFPLTWLPLIISNNGRDDRFYNLYFSYFDMKWVTDVTPVLRKLYRNALVGVSTRGFSKLREQVIAWVDEIETESNADGMRRTDIEKMTDYLYACCRYTAAGNEALIKDIHYALYYKLGETSNESLPDDDENPETESTPVTTENCAKVIDAIFALVREQKIT